MPNPLDAVEHLRSADTRLAALIDRVGPCRIGYRPPTFATLARSIVYQQLSGKAAATIYGRLERAGGPGPLQAEGVLRLAPEQLRGLGLSSQKALYVRCLAESTLAGAIRFDALPGLSDQHVIEHLTAVKGVGVWTAQMFLIFALERPDVLPTADLGIRNAITRLYRLRKPLDAARIQRIARPWRPHASTACWYLWRSLDNTPAM